jgi:hypothetical protein
MKFYGKTSTLIAVGVALIMGAGVAVVYQWYAAEQEKTQQLEERIAILTQQTKRSAVMQRVNEQMEEIANQERRISDEQRIKAEKQTAVAEQMRRNAEEERQNALEAEHRAVEASKVAQSERVIAEQQRTKAEYQKRVADTLSYITLARQLGDVSIKQSESGNQELSQLLAYASQLFNTRYNGDVYTSSVYQSLVIASQSKQQWTTHKGGIYDVAFFNDKANHFVTCSGYGELMKHRQTDDKISTEVLVNNSTYDFRDTYVDRAKGIVYAISRTGHFLIIDNHNTTELLVNNIGALQTMEIIGKQALLFGELGIAQIDTENRAITRTRTFSFKSVTVCFADDYPCIFDDRGRKHIVKSFDQIETVKLPFKGQVTAYASNKISNITTYGMSDGTIYYINPQGQMQKMVGHRSRVTKLKIINWRIYSASYDGRVNLWLADQPKIEPMTIITTNSWILNFTFDEKKEYLWCGDQNGTLTESLISVPMMRQMLKKKIKRNLTREEWYYYIGRNIPYEPFIGKEAKR